MNKIKKLMENLTEGQDIHLIGRLKSLHANMLKHPRMNDPSHPFVLTYTEEMTPKLIALAKKNGFYISKGNFKNQYHVNREVQ